MLRPMPNPTTWMTAVLCLLLGCTESTEDEPVGRETSRERPVTVYVVNYPLKYFAQRIGGRHVEVVFPTPAGEDPSFWMPDAETITAYQQADLVLLNGAGYSRWVDNVTLPKSKLCDTSASRKGQYLEMEDAVTHSHGPAGEHAHAGAAFTTWLDPQLAIAQAEAIRRALVSLRPEHQETFQHNIDALKDDLNDLDRKLADVVARNPNCPVIFSHPVYQYLIRRYQLNAKAVHWEPDEFPTAAMWTDLGQLLRQHPAKWMIWESEPAEQNVAKLSEMGVQSAVFDPCGNGSDHGDYLVVMRQNVDHLTRVFASPP